MQLQRIRLEIWLKNQRKYYTDMSIAILTPNVLYLIEFYLSYILLNKAQF